MDEAQIRLKKAGPAFLVSESEFVGPSSYFIVSRRNRRDARPFLVSESEFVDPCLFSYISRSNGRGARVIAPSFLVSGSEFVATGSSRHISILSMNGPSKIPPFLVSGTEFVATGSSCHISILSMNGPL